MLRKPNTTVQRHHSTTPNTTTHTATAISPGRVLLGYPSCLLFGSSSSLGFLFFFFRQFLGAHFANPPCHTLLQHTTTPSRSSPKRLCVRVVESSIPRPAEGRVETLTFWRVTPPAASGLSIQPCLSESRASFLASIASHSIVDESGPFSAPAVDTLAHHPSTPAQTNRKTADPAPRHHRPALRGEKELASHQTRGDRSPPAI